MTPVQKRKIITNQMTAAARRSKKDAALANHPMAAPLKPRTSTLRVRSIRWKAHVPPMAKFDAAGRLVSQGARVSMQYGGIFKNDGIPVAARVVWPEKRK